MSKKLQKTVFDVSHKKKLWNIKNNVFHLLVSVIARRYYVANVVLDVYSFNILSLDIFLLLKNEKKTSKMDLTFHTRPFDVFLTLHNLAFRTFSNK